MIPTVSVMSEVHRWSTELRRVSIDSNGLRCALCNERAKGWLYVPGIEGHAETVDGYAVCERDRAQLEQRKPSRVV